MALALGEPNPETLMQRLPFRILLNWLAYAEEEPFGPLREAQYFGTLAAILSTSDKKRYQPSDFFPELKVERAPASPETLYQKMVAITKAMGGAVVGEDE